MPEIKTRAKINTEFSVMDLMGGRTMLISF